MKLCISLLALATAGQVHANGLRHLQVCPVPGEGMCTFEYIPVQCGELNCEYSNQCEAGLAGFNEADCRLVNPECPVPDPNMPCTANYDPLTCGELSCEYDNECLANLAGFNVETECTRVNPECPVPDPNMPCTMEYAPVQCGDLNCEYDNTCLANLAGFDVETECTSALPESECPVPGEGMCTMDYNPVKCGELDCEYSNACHAELAGFVNADCTSALPEAECPVPGEGMCTMDYKPVKCGELECEYSNACHAELAGFIANTDCTSAVPETECPVPGEGMCTMDYNPVKCGELGCEYSNACHAELAGFSPNSECTSAMPMQESQCPVPGEGICTADYNPVKCGELECEYPNTCNAELAGFDAATECTSAMPMQESQCPIPVKGLCTTDYNPVKCGELECEYPNACNAELAGFNAATECTSAMPVQEGQCPIPGEGMCTTDYNPVKCGDRECEYPNACNAELAGFDVVTECTSATGEATPELETMSNGDEPLEEEEDTDSSASFVGIAGGFLAVFVTLFV